MLSLVFGTAEIQIDTEAGVVASLTYKGNCLSRGRAPLFRAAFRDADGSALVVGPLGVLSPQGATGPQSAAGLPGAGTVPHAAGRPTVSAQYTGSQSAELCYAYTNGIRIAIRLSAAGETLCWRGSVDGGAELIPEWLELPVVALQPLKGEGGCAYVLHPYNEGAIIDSVRLRQATGFCSQPIEYPSLGAYPVFPNMLCSQFQAYLTDGFGLYIGAHDPNRGPKSIDFSEAETAPDAGPADTAVELRIRTYCGNDSVHTYTTNYDTVWQFFDGGWEQAAELYRRWFETVLPPKVVKIADNPVLPDWYRELPLIVSYPVRGIHDMDEMRPNALFPYTNALPLLERIRRDTGAKLLVLLMHWEGTAPWAPPYVWPPFGGVEAFTAFRDALHARGDLLGVYCSGFGYTEKSNLLAEYDNSETYRQNGLSAAMCAGPDGVVAKSRICTGQRSGYDICPASPEGAQLLDDAYRPLLEYGVDYAQILDQNHGGGQYFCYSAAHGHPSVPGEWMTSSMQSLLSGWNGIAPATLLGCESAAAEPFIGNLLFSDNRFELNWHIGRPVPLYAYIYHEYLRNFMGNQVSSPFYDSEDTLFLRLAYAFAAGDCLTAVFLPDGRIMDHWGGHDFSALPDTAEVLDFISNLTAFSRGCAHEFLYNGRMIEALPFTCTSAEFRTYSRSVGIPDVFSTAWESNGKRAQLFVNHTSHNVCCAFTAGSAKTAPAGVPDELIVPARNAVLMFRGS